ncbi:MAG: histidine kinase [Chitinophagaceae bacterium]
MSITKKKNNHVPLTAIHVLTWGLLSYVFLFHGPMTNMPRVSMVLWLEQMGRLLLLAIVFYANIYFVYDRTFRKKNYWEFVVWILMAVFVVNFLSLAISQALHVNDALIAAGIRPRPKERFVEGFMVVATLMVLGISTSMAAIKHSQNDERLREEAERQRVVSELGQLKAQINPHFFFNTLNNIYALSYIDVEESRRTIQKLSRMMRYVIYETQPDKVPLQKELDFLDSYVALMQLRLPDHIDVSYMVEVDDKSNVIGPMILLPFIENAFKHGVSALHQSGIHIHIKLQGKRLLMVVENEVRTQENAASADAGGIGLDNTIRRLKLLYPGKYQLDIDNKDGKYLVTLHINLDE